MVPGRRRWKPTAQTNTEASKCEPRRPPRPDRLGQLLDVRCAPVRRRGNRGSTAAAADPTRPPSGLARPTASTRNSAAASAYGPPPATARPAAGRRSGELGQVRRVAEDDVVRCVAPVPGQGVADLDADVATPGERACAPSSTAPASTSTPWRTAIPPAAATWSAAAARKRPSPHAGSRTADALTGRRSVASRRRRRGGRDRSASRKSPRRRRRCRASSLVDDGCAAAMAAAYGR